MLEVQVHNGIANNEMNNAMLGHLKCPNKGKDAKIMRVHNEDSLSLCMVFT